MSSSVVAQGPPAWVHLEGILGEVHGGRVIVVGVMLRVTGWQGLIL